MDARKRLFTYRDPYALAETSPLFLAAVRDNIRTQQRHCPEYAAILDCFGFDPECLHSEADLARIPVIPTLFFKRNRLFSIPELEAKIRVTSSGTQGLSSTVLIDRASLALGMRMMITFFRRHRLISALPTCYLILNYEPAPHLSLGAAQTSYGVTKFAPALQRTYLLRDTGSAHAADWDGALAALQRYERLGLPVRLVGLPALLQGLLERMQARGMTCRLNRHSRVLLGGGWKKESAAAVDREALFGLAGACLGISRSHCLDFFSAVEHPIPYCACANNRFHTPIYSRVIIRDLRTLESAPPGQAGLLSFVTPLVGSMPLVSVMTDDLAVMSPAGACACGLNTPAFTWLGRSGLADIQTCAAQAAEVMRR
jgi:phenylacetate-coenzyme A ligase PaaK-like adenylate-forming protein